MKQREEKNIKKQRGKWEQHRNKNERGWLKKKYKRSKREKTVRFGEIQTRRENKMVNRKREKKKKEVMC